MSHEYDILLPDGYFCDLIFTGLPEMPRLGMEVYGTGFDVVPGAAFTTTLALHRLGVKVGWICDFGNDFFSQYVLDAARREHLDDRLFRLHDAPLRRVSASLSFPHDRAFVSYQDPAIPTSPVELVQRYRPRVVLLSSLRFGPEHLTLVAAAHEVGAIVYMDCQHVEPTLDTPGVAEMLRAIDIFAPNESEAIRITGAATYEQAHALLAELIPTVIVKRGAAGAVARVGSQITPMPGISIEVYDTTGAGDCFNTGFLYGYLRGQSLETCLRCGNICGGLSTRGHGGTTVPTAAEVEEWLRRYEG